LLAVSSVAPGRRLLAAVLVTAAALTAPAATGQDAHPVPPEAAHTPVVTVTLTNQLRFEPQSVTVHAGDYVLWRNQSRERHSVTDDPRQAIPGALTELPPGVDPFDSGHIDPGSTFGHTFDAPGTYKYACIHHGIGGMVGVVKVEPRK
jgi:plastocyanin